MGLKGKSRFIMPKSNLSKSKAIPFTYFGLPDASKENKESLLSDHVTREDIEPHLKFAYQKEGYQIVVGIKGSGKTALRRFVELTDKKALSWIIDADHNVLNLDPSSLKGRSGILKNILALEILRSFSINISESYELYGLKKSDSDKLKKVSSRIIDILRKIPEAVQIDAKILRSI